MMVLFGGLKLFRQSSVARILVLAGLGLILIGSFTIFHPHQIHNNLSNNNNNNNNGATLPPRLDERHNREIEIASENKSIGNFATLSHRPLAPPISLTMFTVLKDETSTKSLSQGAITSITAVHSWLALDVSKIILFGVGETCTKFMTTEKGFRADSRLVCTRIKPSCLAEANTGAAGVPRLDCIFKDARKESKSDFLMFTNADLLYFDDLIPAVSMIASQHSNPFIVGKRRNFNFTSAHADEVGARQDWLNELKTKMLKEAIGHPREGIDFMIFPTKHTPKLPPFLVGRIEWDQWTLLQAIGDPSVATVEISEVVFAVHLNHGRFKESHSRTGTKYNKELAMYLPHPHVKETKVHHPGTIWLGRLDEVDYNLVTAGNMWNDRGADYFGQTIDPPHMPCPDCALVPNKQSPDLLLYLAHELTNDRRTVIVIRVTEWQIKEALSYHCHAQAHNVHAVLFATTSHVVYATCKRLNIKCHLLPTDEVGSRRSRSPIIVFLEFVAAALYDGYNVLIASLEYLVILPVEKLVSSRDVDVQHLGLDVSTKLLYLRSRGRTYKMIAGVIEWLSASMAQDMAVAAYSWKEDRLFSQGVEFSIKRLSAHPESVPQVSTFLKSRIGEYNDDTVAHASALDQSMSNNAKIQREGGGEDEKVQREARGGDEEVQREARAVCHGSHRINMDNVIKDNLNTVAVIKSPPISHSIESEFLR